MQTVSRHTASATTPVRRCTVCRTRKSADELVRLSWIADRLIVGQPREGRGAYVCVSADCMGALRPSSASRALKVSVTAEGMDGWLLWTHHFARRRVLECLGLARRQGALTLGADRVARIRPTDGSVVIVAEDVSEGTREDFAWATVFGTQDELGKAVGVGRAGVIRWQVGRLARQARYWLRVWETTRPQEGGIYG